MPTPHNEQSKQWIGYDDTVSIRPGLFRYSSLFDYRALENSSIRLETLETLHFLSTIFGFFEKIEN